MLPHSIAAEVQRLLLEGRHSQRAIARLLGVARGTVRAIAAGRRPFHPDANDGPDPDAGPPTRCRQCGGMVHAPCRLCSTRKFIEKKPKRICRAIMPDMDRQYTTALDLKPEHHARYLQVRQWRKERRGQPLEGASPQ
jgi:hypothetical protein